MWLGGGLFAIYAYTQVAGVDGQETGRHLNALSARGSWFFGIANLLVLGSGIAMVAISDAFGWTDAFVLIGIAGILVSGAWQGLVGTKAEKRMLEAFEGSGSDRGNAVARARSTAYVDVAILVVVIYAMIAKWGAG